MLKKLLRIFFVILLIIILFKAYGFYNHYLEEKERTEYLESLVDTASPTVSVLRDSIKIEYQNEKRTLHVYVPPSYENDTSQNYPVIYMLDGESSFNDMENQSPEWQMDEVINTANANGKPTAIVIGINQSNTRDAEYTPFINEDIPDAHGDKFANWVTTDLKQWVDSQFRTKPEPQFTTIGGISRSGMMAYYMLMAHPDIFGNALIQSPSMWVDYDRLMELELSKAQLENKKIFVSVGEKEGGSMVPHAKDIYNKFKAKGLDDSQVHFELILDEGHWHMTWRKSFAAAYPWLIEGW